MIHRWLDKDHFLFGLGLAIVVPTLFFSALMGLQMMTPHRNKPIGLMGVLN